MLSQKLPLLGNGVSPPTRTMDTSYPREDYLPMASHKQEPSPTVITIRPPVVPRDYMIWSVFNTIYMNLCCLGFVALAYSVKVGRYWVGWLSLSLFGPNLTSWALCQHRIFTCNIFQNDLTRINNCYSVAAAVTSQNLQRNLGDKNLFHFVLMRDSKLHQKKKIEFQLLFGFTQEGCRIMSVFVFQGRILWIACYSF